MVLGDPALQRLPAAAGILPRSRRSRQLGQRRRVVLAGDQRPDHGPARDPQHVGGHARPA